MITAEHEIIFLNIEKIEGIIWKHKQAGNDNIVRIFEKLLEKENKKLE